MKKSTFDNFVNDFRHFSLRLSERYELFITFEEYLFLSKLPYLRNSKTRKNDYGKPDCKIGLLKIKGVDVKVLKRIGGNKSLLTALPLNHYENKRISP